jgi:hypothetical protein
MSKPSSNTGNQPPWAKNNDNVAPWAKNNANSGASQPPWAKPADNKSHTGSIGPNDMTQSTTKPFNASGNKLPWVKDAQ